MCLSSAASKRNIYIIMCIYYHLVCIVYIYVSLSHNCRHHCYNWPDIMESLSSFLDLGDACDQILQKAMKWALT